jgi:GTP-binding protein Era
MMNAVTQAIKDADVLIAIVDVTDRPEQALDMIQPGDDWSGPPMVVLLNKTDIMDPNELEDIHTWYTDHCKASAVIPISAQTGENIERVQEWVLENIPTGSSLYPKDILSEASERFFVAEIIRKHVFLQYRQELPYQVTVQVTQFKQRPPPKKTFIHAQVIVEKERHVKLLVGAKGSAIKQLSSSSRSDIEDFLQLPVYLDLSVKVVPKWRSNDKQLGRLGYI